jgi:hypothetical protein
VPLADALPTPVEERAHRHIHLHRSTGVSSCSCPLEQEGHVGRPQRSGHVAEGRSGPPREHFWEHFSRRPPPNDHERPRHLDRCLDS